MHDSHKIYTVSELNYEIKVILEDSYLGIWLEGEVSNFKTYASGHMYFTLKDSESQISAVAFYGINKYFKFKLEDGIKVIVKGRVSSYVKRGEYQIIVNYIEPAGKGGLQLAFEQLKEKLENEGLFSQERKKTIPLVPQRIGVVTSPDGAAIHDILSVINRRYANVEILIYPVKVQGEEAKYEIADAIKYLNAKYPKLDVLLAGRGGGSFEDLWAFNEEIVARAIAASKIPVISCVGHETDFTIADFVADLRAPTPSAAAELVVKNKSDLVENLYNLERRLINNIKSLLSDDEEKLKYYAESRALRKPYEIFEDRLQELDGYLNYLTQAVNKTMETKNNFFITLSAKLNLLSPLNILNRGYSICCKYPANIILKDVKNIKQNDTVKIKLAKGEFLSKVESIQQ